MIKLKQLVETINEAVAVANNQLDNSSDSIIADFFFEDEVTGNLEAKTVPINYPMTNLDGETDIIEVKVPLITLVPISTPSIEELKFTTNLDVVIDNEEMMVGFSSKDSLEENNSTALLELIIKPQEKSQGLTKLIEGYEKALRVQLPG